MKKTKGRARILAVVLSICMLVQPTAVTYAAENVETKDVVAPSQEPSQEPVTDEEPEAVITESPSAEPSVLPGDEGEQPSEEPSVLPGDGEEQASEEPSILPGEAKEQTSAEPSATPEETPAMTPGWEVPLVKSNEYKNEGINSIYWNEKGTVVVDSDTIVGPTFKCKLEYTNPDTGNPAEYLTDSDADNVLLDATITSGYTKTTGYFLLQYFINENGVYKATIGEMTENESGETEWEEPVEMIYARPAAELSKPTNLSWDGYTLKWNAVKGDNVCGYTAFLYKDGSLCEIGKLVKGVDDLANPQIDFTSCFTGEGNYRAVVRAISSDISKVANSSGAVLEKAVSDYISSVEWQAGKLVVELGAKAEEEVPISADCYLMIYDKNGNFQRGRGKDYSIQEFQSKVTVDLAEFIHEDGIYKAQFGFYATHDNFKRIMSDEVSFTYQRPKTELPLVTGLEWKGNAASWNPVKNANVNGYLVNLYREGSSYSLDSYVVDADTCSCEFTHQFREGDTATGGYYFTVSALSRDVTKIANGKESAASKTYWVENDDFQVSLCDEEGTVTGNITLCKNLDEAFEAAAKLEGPYKRINYIRSDSYVYRTSDTLVIPDVKGKLFLYNDIGTEDYYYGSGIQAAKISVENAEVETVNLAFRRGNYNFIDIDLKGNTFITRGNVPVKLLSGKGKFISKGSTSIDQMSGDMTVEVWGDLDLSGGRNNKSTGGEVYVLNGGKLSLYHSLTVKDFQGNVWVPEFVMKRNNGPLLTLSGKTAGHISFIIPDSYGRTDKTYPTDLAVCILKGADTKDKSFAATYSDGSKANLAVSVQKDKIYVSNCYLSTETVNINVGETTKLELKGTKLGNESGKPDTISGNDMKTITWSSSNEGVAVVDKNGNVEGIGQGDAEIYATISGRTQLSCHVVVTSILKQISLSKAGTQEDPVVLEYTENADASGYALSQDQIKVFFTPADKTTEYENKVKWESSDPAVATVENGLVKAGTQSGLVEITASVPDGENGETLKASSWYKVVKSKVKVPDQMELTVFKNDARYKTLADLTPMLPAERDSDKSWSWSFGGTPSKVKLSDFYASGSGVFPVEYMSPDTGKTFNSAVTVRFEGAVGLELLDQNNNPVNVSTTIQMVKPESTLDITPQCDYQINSKEVVTSYKLKVDKPNLLNAEIRENNGKTGFRLNTNGKAGTVKLTVEAYGCLSGDEEHSIPVMTKVYTFKIVDCSKGIAQIKSQVKNVKDDTVLTPKEENLWSFVLPDDQEKYYLDIQDTSVLNESGSAGFAITCKSDNEKVVKVKKDKSGRWLITPVAAGNAEIVMTANDACKTQESIQVIVKDNSAKAITVSTNKITINSALKQENRYADIIVYCGGDRESLELSLTDKKGNPFVNSVAGENITVEKVMSNGDMIARIRIQSAGNAVETSTAKPYLRIAGNGVEKQVPLTVTIAEKYPSISVKQINALDLVKETGAVFDFSAGDQAKITGWTIKDNENYEKKADGSIDLKDKGNVKKKVAFVISLEGYVKSVVTKEISVKTTSTAYKLGSTNGIVFTDITGEQILQTQILEAGKPMDLSDSTVRLENDKGEVLTGISTSVDKNGSVRLTVTDGTGVKAGKIRLIVDNEELRKPVTLIYQIKTAKIKSAKLKLSSETLKLYTYSGLDLSTASSTAVEISGAGQELVEMVSLSPADQKTREIWNKELTVTFNDSDQKIHASLFDYKGSKAVTYQVKAAVRIKGLAAPLQKTLKIQVNPVNQKDMKKLVTIGTKGQIDVYNTGSYVTVKAKYSNLPSGYEIKKVALDNTSYMAKNLRIDKISDTEFRIYANGSTGLSSIRTNLIFTIGVNDGKESEVLTVRTGEVNIRFVNGKLKSAMSGRNIFNNTGVEQTGQWKLTVTNTQGKEVTIKNAYVSGIYADDFEVNYQEGSITHKGNKATRTGKKYDLPIVVELENSLNGTKPMTLKYKVEIK